MECSNTMLLNTACEMSNYAITFSSNFSKRHTADVNALNQPVKIGTKFSDAELVKVVNRLGSIGTNEPQDSQIETASTSSSHVVN